MPRTGDDGGSRRLFESRALRAEHARRWPYPETYIPGNEVVLFDNGDDAYRAMLDDIAAAVRTIRLETYILKSDATGWRFAHALAERAADGVEIALMYDSIGSLGLASDYVSFLEGRDVLVHSYHPLWPWKPGWNLTRRNHRKILTVDGRVGYVGGMNIADLHVSTERGGEGWRDTHLRIGGPAAVTLDRLFLEEWTRQGGARLEAARGAPGRAEGVAVRVVENRSIGKRARVRAAYADALRHAEKRLWITNSYFLPDGRFLRALMRAAERGVDVRVLVPGKSDVRLVQWATEYLYPRLLGAGVRVYHWSRSVLHAKTAVVDGRWSTVGTFNLDSRSLRYNLEVNATILDHDLAAQMETLFRRDLDRSEEVRPLDLARRPWWRRLRAFLAYQLRKWL